MITRKEKANKPVPAWMFEALGRASQEQPGQHQKAISGIIEKMTKPKPHRIGKVFLGGKYGPANKGRLLSPEEIQAREEEMTARKTEGEQPCKAQKGSP